MDTEHDKLFFKIVLNSESSALLKMSDMVGTQVRKQSSEQFMLRAQLQYNLPVIIKDTSLLVSSQPEKLHKFL